MVKGIKYGVILHSGYIPFLEKFSKLEKYNNINNMM